VHDLEVLAEYSMSVKDKIPLVLMHLQTRYCAKWDRWTVLEETNPLLTNASKAFLQKAITGAA